MFLGFAFWFLQVAVPSPAGKKEERWAVTKKAKAEDADPIFRRDTFFAHTFFPKQIRTIGRLRRIRYTRLS